MRSAGSLGWRSPRWRTAAVATLPALLVASGCGINPGPMSIYNDSDTSVVVQGCTQEQDLRATLAPHARFTFTEDLGSRTLSDDPGFACLLQTPGGLTCLYLPTDQSSKLTFGVREAQGTSSFAACVSKSDPHL